jgi:predicted nucleotidyltransferase
MANNKVPNLNIIATELISQEAKLRAAGISALAIFGSVARGEASESSDVDIAFALDGPYGMLGISKALAAVKSVVNYSVDFVPIKSLSGKTLENIERDWVYVIR